MNSMLASASARAAYDLGIAMNGIDRIAVDPDILVGKPFVKGMRLSVDFLRG